MVEQQPEVASLVPTEMWDDGSESKKPKRVYRRKSQSPIAWSRRYHPFYIDQQHGLVKM
jgi:hypothetical protein